MAIRELPHYVSKYDNIFYVTDADEAVAQIMAHAPTRIALDTETRYIEDLPDSGYGVLTKFIKDSKQNFPFFRQIGVKASDGNLYAWVFPEDTPITAIKPIIEDENVEKILHNFKYDIHMLMNMGVEIRGKVWDTMIMIHLIDEEFMCKTPNGKKIRSKKLKDLSYHFLGVDAHELEDLVNESRKIISANTGRRKDEVYFSEVPKDIIKDYSGLDVIYVTQLFDILLPMLKEQGLEQAYDVDFKASIACAHMERVGLKINRQHYEKADVDLTGQQYEIALKVFDITREEFNINSSNELISQLAKLGAVWDIFTPKGEYDTTADTLKTMAQRYSGTAIQTICELVAKHRKITKVKDTFVAQMLRYADKDDRVHCDFNVCPNDDSQGGTVTGRLSSSNPNFQNIKKDKRDTDDNMSIRRGIIPTKDFVLVEGDYQAQEYKLLGHYSNDKNYMDMIHKGYDIHTGTASMIYNIPYEQVTKEQRQSAKMVNFGLVYGLGLAAFASALGYKIDEVLYKQGSWALRKANFVPWKMPALEVALEAVPYGDRIAVEYCYSEEATTAIAKAKEMKAVYFGQFPAIEQFLKDVIDTVKKRGWVKDWVGRRRHFKKPKEEAYKSPNALIQGGCGSITKDKLWQLHQFLKPYKSRMVNTIHDSIMFEVHKDELFLIDKFAEIMSDLPQFRVPLGVDMECSTVSWGLKHKMTIEEIEKELEAA